MPSGNSIRLGLVGVALGIAAPLILGHSAYYLNVLSITVIFVLLVVGLNFILGYTGLFSFAQVGFFAIGAYVEAVLIKDHAIPFWLAFAAAAFAPVIVSRVLGYAVLRLRSHYFMFVTFVIGEICRQIAVNWTAVTHGTAGITGIPRPQLGSYLLQNNVVYYYLILAIVGILVLAASRLERSPLGRSLMAIRQSEVAAAAMGVQVQSAKALAFDLSALYAGVAGALYAPLIGVISPDVFTVNVSISVLVSLLLGGLGSVVGAVIGTLLIYPLPEWLRFLGSGYLIVYGLLIIFIMILLPKGIVGKWRIWQSSICASLSRKRMRMTTLNRN